MYEILLKFSIAYEPPCYTKTCKWKCSTKMRTMLGVIVDRVEVQFAMFMAQACVPYTCKAS